MIYEATLPTSVTLVFDAIRVASRHLDQRFHPLYNAPRTKHDVPELFTLLILWTNVFGDDSNTH